MNLDLTGTIYAISNGHSNQQLIRDSHESKYLAIKDHPELSIWKGNQDNRGQYKDNIGQNQK